jgi:hypothetical protein
MITIGHLRKNAELNLCPDCFKKYRAIIEPSIMHYLAQPLDDFRQAESQITQIVMKVNGVFKGGIWVLSMGEGDEDKVDDDIDVKAYRKIEKWGFKQNIDYLYKNGILRDSSYGILNKARKARNKIHSNPTIGGLSMDDYTLFSMAHGITTWIFISLRFNSTQEITSNILFKVEEVAEKWLIAFQDMKPNS